MQSLLNTESCKLKLKNPFDTNIQVKNEFNILVYAVGRTSRASFSNSWAQKLSVPSLRGKEDIPIKFTDEGGESRVAPVPSFGHVMYTTMTGESLAEHRSGFSSE
jgi:hypothetical protein